MNKKKILIILRTAFASRTAHHVLSLLLTGLMLGGIGLTLRSDIEDIKFYVQSVLERDPNFKIIQESVSENMIRGNIDIKSEFLEEQEEVNNLVSNDTKNGYDSYTPKQPSQSSSNSSSFTTSSNSSSNNNSNTSNSNNNNSNNNNVKQEEVVDKSNLYGKDTIISEGQPFNPMNALQLYACDITGENITNSIVITENNVDIYKPGVYNVKASIALKNGKTLDKKFAVRVEPTVLDLAVNDVKTSKTELKKEEDYTMNFAVNSSKSYIDVEKVVINKNEYEVEKVFEDDVERYSVNLEAPNKAGNETLKLQKVIMSDKTIVDVNKAVNINVLKEDATLEDVIIKDESEDVIIKDESNENNTIGISFKLKDVDNTIKEPKICIYDEENNLILEQKFSKNKYSSFTKVSTKVNLNKAGIYTVKVLANKNDEPKEQDNEEKSIELFSKEIAVNMKAVSDDEDMNLLPMNGNYDEDVEAYSEANLNSVSNDEDIEGYSEEDTVNFRNILRASSGNITGTDTTEQRHEISITGNVVSDSGEMPSGRFQVVVPTTASFTVDKDGKFIGTTITIRNQGYQNIDVYAYKFIDVDGSEGINVKPKSEVTDQSSRSDIAMNIYGNNGTAYFKTENVNEEKTGIYNEADLKTSASSDGIKISRISANSQGTLTLRGEAGKNSNIDTAISNTFTLILKIKRSTN